MTKYHINPKTGKTGICTAKQGACRFGESTLHYSNQDDAQKAFEISMEGKTFSILKKSTDKKKIAKANLDLAINTNLDPNWPYDDPDIMWDQLSKAEQRDVSNNDTIVRDWYWDARDNGLKHSASLSFAKAWDEHLHYFDIDNPNFNWHKEYSDMLKDYVNGRKTADSSNPNMNPD